MIPDSFKLAKISEEVRRIELRSKRAIGAELIGAYRSAFRGQGLIYSDCRDYQPGDDVKHIYWKASARTSRILVKTFEEERHLRVMLVLDVSRSTCFANKYSNALSFAALVAAVAQRSNDSLGLCIVSDHIHEYLEPKHSRFQFHRVLGTLFDEREFAPHTDLNAALEDLRRRLTKRSIVFVISDFVSGAFDLPLRRLAVKHDVVCVLGTAHEDRQLPKVGLLSLQEAEGKERMLFDTSNQAPGYPRFYKQLQKTCLRAKADLVRLTDPLLTLQQLLRARAKSPNRVVVGI